MRTTTALAAAATAGAAALVLVAVPALGATSTPTPSASASTAPGYGYGHGPNGQHAGQGRGPMANGPMANGTGAAARGSGACLTGTTATGTLTSAQKTTLAGMAEEEKLAHDLYVTLAAKYPSVPQFSRIATAETRHLEAVRTLLSRYGLTDPTAGTAVGDFASASFQSQYDALLAGATSSSAALAAGVSVEKADIAALTDALKGLSAPDVTQVYTSLRTASQHHLTAFGG